MNRFVPVQGRKVRAGVSVHQLECLEQRRLFAVVTWDGGGDGVNWNDPKNWSGDMTPGDNDDVTIGAGATAVTLAGASEWVKSVSCSRQLVINGPLLTVTGATTLNAATKIQGYGSLSIGGTLALNAAMTLGNASDNSNGDIYFTSSSAQTFGGTGGSVTAVGNDISYVINAGSSTLTIPTGFNIGGKNFSIFASNFGATIVNNGIISANVAGGSCSVSNVSSNAGTIQATNGGTLTIATGLATAGTINVGAGSTVAESDNLISTGTLTVAGALRVVNQLQVNGGTAVATKGANAVIKVGSLLVGAGRQLNLNDNDMIVDYTGTSSLGSWNGAAYTGLTGMIQQGRNGGLWTGSGIVTGMTAAKDPSTLTTLGIAEASQVLGLSGTQTTLWDGQTVDATTVLIKYTYSGDANLDGIISGDDYFQVDSSYPQHVRGFAAGDFDYDGVVGGDDYFLIDSDFPVQGSPL